MSILHDPGWVIHQLREHLLHDATVIPGGNTSLTYGQLAAKVLQSLDAPLDDPDAFGATTSLTDFVHDPSAQERERGEIELPVTIYCPTWVPPIFSADEDDHTTVSPSSPAGDDLQVTDLETSDDITQVRALIEQQQQQILQKAHDEVIQSAKELEAVTSSYPSLQLLLSTVKRLD